MLTYPPPAPPPYSLSSTLGLQRGHSLPESATASLKGDRTAEPAVPRRSCPPCTCTQQNSTSVLICSSAGFGVMSDFFFPAHRLIGEHAVVMRRAIIGGSSASMHWSLIGEHALVAHRRACIGRSSASMHWSCGPRRRRSMSTLARLPGEPSVEGASWPHYSPSCETGAWHDAAPPSHDSPPGD